MSKKQEYKKVTLKDLIANKEALKAKKREIKQIYVQSIDGIIKFQKPDAQLCIEAVEMDDRGDKYLIYNCVTEPNLKDEELLKAFNVVEPIDIVEEIFEFGEIKTIANKILQSVGFGDSATIVDEIKN